MNRRTLLIGAGAALTATGAAGALLLPRQLAPALTYQKDGLAIGGTDPVAYFTHARPMAGDAAFAQDWNGATWTFLDDMHRAAFAADPDAYAPRYGGFCAWAVAAKSELYSTDPDNWSIVDGRLYLNFDDGVQETWNTDRAGFIRQADANWPALEAAA